MHNGGCIIYIGKLYFPNSLRRTDFDIETLKFRMKLKNKNGIINRYKYV